MTARRAILQSPVHTLDVRAGALFALSVNVPDGVCVPLDFFGKPDFVLSAAPVFDEADARQALTVTVEVAYEGASFDRATSELTMRFRSVVDVHAHFVLAVHVFKSEAPS